MSDAIPEFNVGTFYDSGNSVYTRVFCASGSNKGKVFDFSDNSWKLLSAATEPYIECTEYADMAGTGESYYAVELDLSAIGDSVESLFCKYHFYVYSSSPADDDAVIRNGGTFWTRFKKFGTRNVRVQMELNVKSTTGSSAQLSCNLEIGEERIPLTDYHAAPTCQITVREHGSETNLFVANGTVSDLIDNCFEIEQSLPNFTDDRQYSIAAQITLGTKTFETYHSSVVIG